MSILKLRGIANGDFGAFSAGARNRQLQQGRYAEANAGDRYAAFRAKQHHGQGLPPPAPPS